MFKCQECGRKFRKAVSRSPLSWRMTPRGDWIADGFIAVRHGHSFYFALHRTGIYGQCVGMPFVFGAFTTATLAECQARAERERK